MRTREAIKAKPREFGGRFIGSGIWRIIPPPIFLVCLGLCCGGHLDGATRTYEILGGKHITCGINAQGPVRAHKDGIWIDRPSMLARPSEFTYHFVIESRAPIKKILVEDVTDTSAKELVTDPAPKFKDGKWIGDSAIHPLSKRMLPWLFAPGASTRIYRFTITEFDKKHPVILYQPVVWSVAFKKVLKKLAVKLKSIPDDKD